MRYLLTIILTLVSSLAFAITPQNFNGLAGGLTGTPNIAVGTVATTGVTINGTTQLTGYKEGTWTPTPTGLTVVGSPNYTGTYTRIGNRVFISLYFFAGTSTASVFGSTYFTGLPYVPATDESGYVTLGLSGSNGFALVAANGKLFTPTWAANPYGASVNCNYKTTDAF